MKRRGKVAAAWLGAVSLLAAGGGAASDRAPLVPEDVRQGLAEALAALNLAEHDPGFEKDYAQPRLVLPSCRRALKDPWALSAAAETALRIAADGLGEAAWAQVRDWSGLPASAPAAEAAAAAAAGIAWPPGLQEPLARFYAAFEQAGALLEGAFAALALAEREALAASYLTGVLNAEEDAGARADLAAAGIAEAAVQRAVAESWELDEKPAATRFLDAADKIRRAELLAAGAALSAAAERLARETEAGGVWPEAAVEVPTPRGAFRIGTRGDEVHETDAVCVLDPGGRDVYRGWAGAANGLRGRPLAAIVDLGGDDRYESGALGGAGAALWGAAAVLDRQGRDRYGCRLSGQAAGIFGAAWLRDAEGDDEYRCGVLGQAAAFVGAGLLEDEAGNDTYQAGAYAQGFGGLLGIGWLSDRGGHDRYCVGGREPDYERHPHRFLSFGQGAALGLRPEGGGGIGLLIDGAGNDIYLADVYGQGVGYWYAMGLLLDLAGHDSYQVYEYGQGTGIHLSSGLLYEGGGNDLYGGFSLCQGSAHDFAVGLLLEAGGDDTYTADHYAQGRAINNSFALLADRSGRDAYFARRNDECQGRGEWNAERGFGGLSVLLDLAGADQYSSGLTNGRATPRPWDGVVYDAPECGEPTAAEEAGAGADGGRAGAERIEWQGRELDPAALGWDELMFHASRYGSTEARRRNKRIAWRELAGRGTATLRYLVSSAEKENIWFWLRARELLGQLPPREAAETLLELAESPSVEVRKMAVALLADCDTPQHAPRIRPLLADTNVCGAAARALGRWRDAAAVEGIAALLADPLERRRAQAATALGQIGSAAAAEPLLAALEDVSGLVRQAARRALARLPADAVGPRLTARLASATGAPAREAARCLGLLRYRPACRELGRLAAQSEDPGLRYDAARALRQIDPARAEALFRRLRRTETHPLVRGAFDEPREGE